MTPTLAIFGANGATGRHAVRLAAARGHEVRAIGKSWPGEAPDLPHGVTRATADILTDDLAPHIEGCDAILSCIGLPLTPQTALSPPPLYTEGTRNYLDAMARTGTRRIVVISASFVETLDRGPILFRAAAATALQPIFAQMGEMERLLRASDTEWTAVRPGWLMPGDPTGDATITPDAIAQGLIRTRHGDLARLMLDCLEDDTWVRRCPAIARAEPLRVEGSAALMGEITP